MGIMGWIGYYYFIAFFTIFAPPLATLVSLFQLSKKQVSYWHWRNASTTLGFLVLYATYKSFNLPLPEVPFWQSPLWGSIVANVLILIVGIYGFYIWNLERRRDRNEIQFDEPRWRATTLVILAAVLIIRVIFLISTSGTAAFFLFNILLLTVSLAADFAIIGKWSWAWLGLILTNLVSVVSGIFVFDINHFFLNWQTVLPPVFQSLNVGMCVYGWIVWRKPGTRVKLDLA
jgi:hypothetical protein